MAKNNGDDILDDFDTRKKSAEQLIKQLLTYGINDAFTQSVELWKAGYSLRIIQDLTGIHRSKLSRYINEHKIQRDDDIRTQNRKNRVYQCQKLHKMGFTREEIAQELNINPRTVDSYFKELGIKRKTLFVGDLLDY